MPFAASRTDAFSMQQRHSLGGSCGPAKRRCSTAGSIATTASSAAPSSALDLGSLRVSVAELRLTADGTWLYVLRVTTASTRGWHVQRRYSELRAFWESLRAAMDAHGGSCAEHCHFLAGLETDKFPKKRLLHTRSAIEARANELDDFLLRLTMRLNLSSAPAAAACRARGCPVLALLGEFLRPERLADADAGEDERSASAATSPASSPSWTRRRARAPLTKYRSFPLLRVDAENRFLTKSGRRLSFQSGVQRSM